MEQLKQTIEKLRKQGLSDESIFKVLKSKGWSDSEIAQLIVVDYDQIPSKKASEETQIEQLSVEDIKQPEVKAKIPNQRPIISSVETALHNIFLWVFSFTFIVNIEIIIDKVINFDGFKGDFWKIIASSLTALIITSVVYWVFYYRFIKEFKQDRSTKFKNGWVTATLVFSGLSFIGSLTSLIVGLIWSPDIEAVIKILPIIAFSAVIIINYAQINFGKIESNFRLKNAKLFYQISVLMIFILAIGFSLLKYANNYSDIQTKQDIVEAVNKIYNYSKKHNQENNDCYDFNCQKTKKLPSQLSDLGVDKELRYRIIKTDRFSSSFEICADFKHKDKDSKLKFYNPKYEGDYAKLLYSEIDLDDIRIYKVGENCYKFRV